jgi:membrane protease YdiL (CAAX protease family)
VVALFGVFLQVGLPGWGAGRRFCAAAASAPAAVLFGLVHFAGGAGYVLVAGLAGVGYGLAYRRGGLQASVMAHFGLNLLHFSLFAYPMLAR